MKLSGGVISSPLDWGWVHPLIPSQIMRTRSRKDLVPRGSGCCYQKEDCLGRQKQVHHCGGLARMLVWDFRVLVPNKAGLWVGWGGGQWEGMTRE